MIVVDRSDSVGDEGRAAAGQFVREAWDYRDGAAFGVVAFDGRAELWMRFEDVLSDHVSDDDPLPRFGPAKVPGSDVAGAVRLAAAALPDGGQRRIVLLTDGRATRGDALDEVRRAEQRGITVDVVPIGAGLPKAPTLARAHAREPRVAEGEPATVIAEVRGEPGARAQVAWLRDGKDFEETVVVIGPTGTGEAVLTDGRPGPGVHVYEARLAGSTPMRTAVLVGGRPRALVVTLDAGGPGVLQDALAKAEIDRQVIPLGDARLDPAALSGADLVVLADVPLAPAGDGSAAAGLTPSEQEALVDFAQKGGGVLVTGGAFGFAPEYSGAPIARMLPVEIEDQGQVEDPRVAMAIMLDRSGSMGMRVGTHTKIQLAVEAALAASSTLRPDDSVAIGSVDTKTHWDQPLGPIAELAARRDRIRTIDAGGGGIYVYTALVDAYASLRGANAPVRHVILFSDTADSEEQAEGCVWGRCENAPHTALEIAETARRAGVTTSVVGIGRAEDRDTEFLRKLAIAGGGRFYLTSQATDLRRIFVSEARVATRSNLREGPIDVAVAEDHPILAGVDVARMPPLGGFVETKRRATADTALVTQSDRRPIVASWRYGLGKVVAITTDLRADWKGGWAGFGGAGQMLRQALRYAVRRHGARAADVRVAVSGRAADVTVELPLGPDDAAGAPASVEAFALGPDGASRPVAATLTQSAPGRWTARARTAGEPFVVTRVRDAAGALVGEAIGQTDAANELAGLGPDERALRSLARAGEGEYAPDPAAAMRRGGPRGKAPVALWPWILLSAAALACADLWLRRAGKRRATLALPVTPPARSKPEAPIDGRPADAPARAA